ncbi:MAG TPA: acyltransferase [Bacteroidota bacterium]|nr:acyltransferase [Bacteroidota bacterium]
MSPTAHIPPASLGERLLAPFRRVTSSGGFISEIDGLRFIAIGAVVLFHLLVGLALKAPEAYAMPASGNLLTLVGRNGFRGVELFFIISGFILASPFASARLLGKAPVNLGSYFLRRLTRLEPPYILAMTGLYLIRASAGSAGALLPHLGAGLVYCHNLLYHADNPVNNVAWSLEIEVQFYVLVPLLASVFNVRSRLARRGIIVGVILASVVNEWLFITPESWLYLSIVRFLHFFLVGFLLADMYLVDWRGRPSLSPAWDAVTLLGWPALVLLLDIPGPSPASYAAAAAFPFLALLLYVAVFRGTVTNRIMTNPWITTIGGMCYTIYLIHNPLLGMLIGMTARAAPSGSYTVNVLAQGLVTVVPMLCVAALYFAAIERPCMRRDWPQRALRWMRGVVARPVLQEVKSPMSDQV